MQIETNGLALGDEVRDPITDMEGTITGITQWLTGCARAIVQGKAKADGTIPDGYSVDVPQLVLVKAGPNHETAPAPIATGGPAPSPTRPGTPRR